MIHFLISHSISLYCQTEREGKKGTDRDMRGGGTDEEESKQRKKWRAGNERKKKGKKRRSPTKPSHSATDSSAAGLDLIKLVAS